MCRLIYSAWGSYLTRRIRFPAQVSVGMEPLLLSPTILIGELTWMGVATSSRASLAIVTVALSPTAQSTTGCKSSSSSSSSVSVTSQELPPESKYLSCIDADSLHPESETEPRTLISGVYSDLLSQTLSDSRVDFQNDFYSKNSSNSDVSFGLTNLLFQSQTHCSGQTKRSLKHNHVR